MTKTCRVENLKKPRSKPLYYCFFTTAFGQAAIFFNETGISRFVLPPSKLSAMALSRAERANPPKHIEAVIKKCKSYFDGKSVSFEGVKLDLTQSTSFERRVYAELFKIPYGSLISYKGLAAACKSPRSFRAAANAVAKNPLPLIIPCHRVISSNGKLGGFSVGGGVNRKITMLESEGIKIMRKPVAHIKPSLCLKAVDYKKALRRLKKVDWGLSKLIRLLPNCTLNPNPQLDIFSSLLESIIAQQLSPKAASTIYARVKALFSAKGAISPFDIIRASDEELRSSGLSFNKASAIRDLADFASSGRLPTNEELQILPDEALISRLSQIKGIGRWTVEMLLIFGLGRADVISKDDLGLRRGLSIIRGQERPCSSELLKEEAEKWRPYRSIASWYLWRAAELTKT